MSVEQTVNTHKWYVIHTYSGFEKTAQKALEEKIRSAKMEAQFSEVLVPEESVVEVKKGVKKTSSQKFFPGYMLVKMELNDYTQHLVRSVPKVTGFVGSSKTPPSIPEEEVMRITTKISEGTMQPRPKVSFDKGESIRVTDGPFTNFNGIVEEVKPDKGKVRVLVSIFGRSTPVELNFAQLEKN